MLRVALGALSVALALEPVVVGLLEEEIAKRGRPRWRGKRLVIPASPLHSRTKMAYTPHRGKRTGFLRPQKGRTSPGVSPWVSREVPCCQRKKVKEIGVNKSPGGGRGGKVALSLPGSVVLWGSSSGGSSSDPVPVPATSSGLLGRAHKGKVFNDGDDEGPLNAEHTPKASGSVRKSV
ncbi:hypothetical protein GWK47_049811 [Chionoecetes opilio]|uniref:Uncharacterized protein n=1 Tax=Chionoecetes opilio TaxID=41210 RepID=A0A8J4Y289_CHIOP|nr:hypothetical protein GWK47_049811 [Chionoecetes opilio]